MPPRSVFPSRGSASLGSGKCGSSGSSCEHRDVEVHVDRRHLGMVLCEHEIGLRTQASPSPLTPLIGAKWDVLPGALRLA
jgi:hypothetical protein